MLQSPLTISLYFPPNFVGHKPPKTMCHKMVFVTGLPRVLDNFLFAINKHRVSLQRWGLQGLLIMTSLPKFNCKLIRIEDQLLFTISTNKIKQLIVWSGVYNIIQQTHPPVYREKSCSSLRSLKAGTLPTSTSAYITRKGQVIYHDCDNYHDVVT